MASDFNMPLQPVPPRPLLLDESTAARVLGDVSPKSLYNWRKDGSLRCVKLGTRTMYRPEDLADFIARRQVKRPPP